MICYKMIIIKIVLSTVVEPLNKNWENECGVWTQWSFDEFNLIAIVHMILWIKNKQINKRFHSTSNVNYDDHYTWLTILKEYFWKNLRI